MSLSVCPCLPVCLLVCLSISLFPSPFLSLFQFKPIRAIFLKHCLSNSSTVRQSFNQPVRMSTWLSVCIIIMSVYLSFSLFSTCFSVFLLVVVSFPPCLSAYLSVSVHISLFSSGCPFSCSSSSHFLHFPSLHSTNDPPCADHLMAPSSYINPITGSLGHYL